MTDSKTKNGQRKHSAIVSIIELLKEQVATEELRETVKQRDALTTESSTLKEYISCCWMHRQNKLEGVIDALAETPEKIRVDLVHCRFCHAYLEFETQATEVF